MRLSVRLGAGSNAVARTHPLARLGNQPAWSAFRSERPPSQRFGERCVESSGRIGAVVPHPLVARKWVPLVSVPEGFVSGQSPLVARPLAFFCAVASAPSHHVFETPLSEMRDSRSPRRVLRVLEVVG